jgi:phosphoribosylamine---glycine ligase
MRVLVVGAGAREHALCWRLSLEGADVRVAPGNALMSDVAHVVGDVALTDLDGLVRLASAARVDLVVVGPEAPLADGLIDRLTAAGVPAFGPTLAAARLEASKAFAREICHAAGVTMATGAAFTSTGAAIEAAEMLGGRVVVKADGLAAGKGVTVCESLAQAETAIRDAIDGNRFGDSGQRVVVEEVLDGVEASVIAMCDGADAVVLPAARDHKRLLEEDQGPNTGGMGAYSPIPELGEAELLTFREKVFLPVLREMNDRGTPFRGALFAGLMLTADGPRVLEFNARLGDPETQVIVPRLAEPLLPLLTGQRTGGPIARVIDDAAVGVALAAGGYPDAVQRGHAVTGVEAAIADGALVFGAGVAIGKTGLVETAGGRVLTVVGRRPDVASAAEAAYAAADRIAFAGKQLRRDIGRSIAAVAA